MDALNRKKEYILLVAMGALLFTITFTIVLKQAQIPNTDYQLHMQSAASFWSLFPYHITYPLWHFLVYLTYLGGWYLLGEMPLMCACAFITSVVNVLIFVIIQRIFTRYYGIIRASLAAFAMCIVMPVFIPWFNGSVYVGKISPVTWHNPTNLMVKPFALIIFFLVAEMCKDIQEERAISRKRYIVLAVLVFCSMLAKPSFFQGFVPALGIYVLICLIATKFRKWKQYLFLCLAFVPAFLMMLVQFGFTFHTGAGEGVGIGWLEVFNEITISPFISTLLGAIFPLGYIILNLKKCWKEIPVRLAVLTCITGWLEFALIYENGPRKGDANFMWAVMLGYTILWVVTSGMFFRDVQKMNMDDRKGVAKNTVLFILWMVHLICGVYYAWNLIMVPGLWM